jgi:hypothetical protein
MVATVAGVVCAAIVTIAAPLDCVRLAHAQTAEAARVDDVSRAKPMVVPFNIGEKLVYEVKFGPLSVGKGTMEVLGIESVRGRDAWHTAFTVKGGTFFYRVNDVFESWMDTHTLSSLRFVQDQEEGGRDREKRFEIYPERSAYIEQGKAEKPSVSQPLDDGSFLYFVRTVPLEVGESYEFNRYFRPDRNPVTIKVLRKERISVPAGKFDAIVVQPIIVTNKIFSKGGKAEVWLSDDSARVMLQMKSKLSFGTLNLYLKSIRPGQTTSAATVPNDR